MFCKRLIPCTLWGKISLPFYRVFLRKSHTQAVPVSFLWVDLAGVKSRGVRQAKFFFKQLGFHPLADHSHPIEGKPSTAEGQATLSHHWDGGGRGVTYGSTLWLYSKGNMGKEWKSWRSCSRASHSFPSPLRTSLLNPKNKRNNSTRLITAPGRGAAFDMPLWA